MCAFQHTGKLGLWLPLCCWGGLTSPEANHVFVVLVKDYASTGKAQYAALLLPVQRDINYNMLQMYVLLRGKLH